MEDALVVQAPDGDTRQLFLLFHGVGGTPQDLAPLARRLAQAFPQAVVVCVAAPHTADHGTGRQWFSVQGVTEDNRPERVQHGLPAFQHTVQAWQSRCGVAPEATALVGFSQGAIMVLESTQTGPMLSGRVVALAGRFARPPEHVPERQTWHLVHGKSDPVIHYGHTITAAERLIALGGDVTADVIPGLGHGIGPEVEDLVIERLTTHLPQWVWREAMNQAQADRDGD